MVKSHTTEGSRVFSKLVSPGAGAGASFGNRVAAGGGRDFEMRAAYNGQGRTHRQGEAGRGWGSLLCCVPQIPIYNVIPRWRCWEVGTLGGDGVTGWSPMDGVGVLISNRPQRAPCPSTMEDTARRRHAWTRKQLSPDMALPHLDLGRSQEPVLLLGGWRRGVHAELGPPAGGTRRGPSCPVFYFASECPTWNRIARAVCAKRGASATGTNGTHETFV
jgi:hypothetical protein